ncbi:hypothetical protein SAMN05421678_1313 [Actinopolymorpha cephalotaxi]|uniref:SnoaL-like domain-containing protein n=1 Tax=Actinopolymorpha cephalotaxi TaxID=504797 RepID=A0A1I3CA06_9ACTN|nr:nuclear transport factor 2 family protein [Actinopolymorpha cephalotaxi]NYH86741.1 hypothetical protein [Actinopolymorpha cephalotaxi]SFH71384.1 hypothetical protein SAMN05421678_1313 [Actinopolymorpha cephalotaxi]
MNAADTQAVIERYFEVMGRGEDFSTFYADVVSWTTFDGATTIVGPSEVRDYITELHNNMPDGESRIVYADGIAYIEGYCADPRGTGADRIAWCLAYDVADGVITSARLYGELGFLVPGR